MHRILNSFLFTFFIFFGASIASYSQDKAPATAPTSVESKVDDVKEAVDAKVADGVQEELSQEELLKKKLTKKKKPKTKSDIIKGMILTIIGGLGIFLLGMKFMSDGIQTVAGSSLRKLIKTVTDNKYMACSVGVLITVLV